jgi:hypothetical protein
MSQEPEVTKCLLLTNIFPKAHKIRNNLEKCVHTSQIGPSQVVRIELSVRKRNGYVLGKHQFIITGQIMHQALSCILSLLFPFGKTLRGSSNTQV